MDPAHTDALVEQEEAVLRERERWSRYHDTACREYRQRIVRLHRDLTVMHARYQALKNQRATASEPLGSDAMLLAYRAEIERSCAERLRLRMREAEQRAERELVQRRQELEAEFANRCAEHAEMVRQDMRSDAERRLRVALMERVKAELRVELQAELRAEVRAEVRAELRADGRGEPRPVATSAVCGKPSLQAKREPLRRLR